MRRLIALSLIFAAAPLRMSESPGTRSATKISTPVLSAPASPELREVGLARSQ
jgi:hypothetical protein